MWSAARHEGAGVRIRSSNSGAKFSRRRESPVEEFIYLLLVIEGEENKDGC